MSRFAILIASLLVTVSACADPKLEDVATGPFVQSSVTMQDAKNDTDASGIVMKGITVLLKEDGKPAGAACFDTTFCRWAGAWYAPAANQPALTFDRAHSDGAQSAPVRSRIVARGPLLFKTAARPGWLGPEDAPSEPRPEPRASQPPDRVHWRGTHVSGDQVVLSYTVQEVAIHELVAFKNKNGIRWFERILEVGASKRPLTLLVCDANGGSPAVREDVAEFQEGDSSTVALWDSPHGEDLIFTWRLVDGAICLEIPPHDLPAHMAIRIWHGAADAQPDRGAWEEAAETHAPLPELSEFAR